MSIELHLGIAGNLAVNREGRKNRAPIISSHCSDPIPGFVRRL